jgi:hypothetical protein
VFTKGDTGKRILRPVEAMVKYHEGILYLTKHHTMNMYGVVEVQLHVFLVSALDVS